MLDTSADIALNTSVKTASITASDLLPKHPSILAGNSRLELDSNNQIKVEAQIHAFEAALTYAARIYQETGCLPPISIAFDHKGIFCKQFLIDGLTNSQKRNPRLSQLKRDAVEPFAEIAHKTGISLDHITVIREDSARSHMTHLCATTAIPKAVANRIVAKDNSNQVTCAAIVSEYFRKSTKSIEQSQELSIVLEVFFEDTPWSRVLTFVRGLQLAHSLGLQVGLRLNLVTTDGSVHPGDLVLCNQPVA